MKFVAVGVCVIFSSHAFAQSRPAKPSRPSQPLRPLVSESFDDALRRDQPVIAAVVPPGDAALPDLFRDASLARASRVSVALAIVEYADDAEFFRSRRLKIETFPTFLVADPLGNVRETHAGKVEPRVLLAGARNARSLMQNIKEELPAVLARAEALARDGNETALLELCRPWFAKHYRGYPELSRLAELVCEYGRPKLVSATSRPSLEALAAEYADTSIEAAAWLKIALLERAERPDLCKTICLRIVRELAWPENAEIVRQARALLSEFRQAEIKRRTRDLELQKRYEPELPEILQAVQAGRVLCGRR